MLTHVYMLVYTLWCWHTLRRRWSLKGEERMGSSLPPAPVSVSQQGTLPRPLQNSHRRNRKYAFHFLKSAENRLASSAGFGAFEKMKCIFSIAPVGILEKSWECSSLRNTHRTLAVEAPDTEDSRPVCCGARVKHRTVLTGRWVTPVHTSGAI